MGSGDAGFLSSTSDRIKMEWDGIWQDEKNSKLFIL